MSFIRKLFSTKPLKFYAQEEHNLRRCLTAMDLTMLGVGAIIGAGIFVLTGIAAETQAGPAVIFSYLLAGLACGFSALAYAELASVWAGAGVPMAMLMLALAKLLRGLSAGIFC